METKKCKLILNPYHPIELKVGDYVEYICYSMHRTTDRALGKVKEIRNGFYVLGNHEMYNIKDLTPMSLSVVSDDNNEVIATSDMIGYSKDLKHDENSCHLCVPVEACELNDIMENKSICYIEMKNNSVKLVDNKVTFILN